METLAGMDQDDRGVANVDDFPPSGRFALLPPPVRSYLRHSIAEGEPTPSSVQLAIHGEMKVGKWASFKAEGTLCVGRWMAWEARTKIAGFPFRVCERLFQGYGQREKWLGGVVPTTFGRGTGVNRSNIALMAAESVLLPSLLQSPSIRWSSRGERQGTFKVQLFGQETEVDLTLSPEGKIETIAFDRWGTPNDSPPGLYRFGGFVDEETTFGGLTIPSRLRLGWFFGSDRFEAEGERFRIVINRAEFS